MQHNFKDFTGKRFGRLLVKELHPERDKEYRARWICECDCGKKAIVCGKMLSIGHTKSCGCLKIDLAKAQCGEKNPAWKGGIDNKGSEALVNCILGAMKYSAKRSKYKDPTINIKVEDIVKIFKESD